MAGEEGAEDGKRKLMPTEAKDNSSPMGPGWFAFELLAGCRSWAGAPAFQNSVVLDLHRD